MTIVLSAYRALLMGLVAVIVAIVAIAVVFRYVLNTPLIFSFDLATVLFVWLVFLGLAQAAHEGSHMAVDLFTALLPAPIAKALGIAVKLLMIAIMIFLIRHSWDLAMRTRMEIASMRISMMWVYLAMPAGFTVFALYEAWALAMSVMGRPALGRQSA
ncbi:TRAP transporter small permease subunit [Mesorhizobium sp. 1M-11]|uniref:TRAP transporter small permease n=1 Tax=Mesorhizobium sp. 1M-11 TaxID=1529006 RepID=UPI0006C73BB4|nr:TRAP transporter small permease subunit [Mesorhizobium sp. 1M-11]